MSQELNIDTRTSINLTQSLQASINILQMSRQDLSVFLNDVLMSNPFLEYDSDSISLPESYSGYCSSIDDPDFDNNNLSNERQISLKDHVLRQIALIFSADDDIKIAIYLSDMLNDIGYLEEVHKNIDYNNVKIQNVLTKLQHEIEPSGLFARNVQECIAIQLRDLNMFDENINIILNNLDLIASNNICKLSKISLLNPDEICDKISLIKSVNPKPGLMFASPEEAIVKIPDVFVEILNDTVFIYHNDDLMPKLQINNIYYQNIKNSTKDKARISHYFSDAQHLIGAITYRKKTLLRVVQYIVDYQREYLFRGALYLRPLTLSDVAVNIGMHESTVSRAVANKYIGTPFGTVDLKYFFSSSLYDKHGSKNISSTKVKELIRSIISTNINNNTTSDRKIAEYLEQMGVQIARRTIAKYRKGMNIMSSIKRK